MKKILIVIFLALGGIIFATFRPIQAYVSTLQHEYKTGDIIYQSSDYGQSKAVKLATHSKYSHVGMIVMKDEKPYVFEAVQPVQMIPLELWIARHPKNEFCLQRLKQDIDLSVYNEKLATQSAEMLGKNYDLLFEWSNEKLYCSELVWKIYKDVYGIELCKLKKLKDFDLTHPVVKYKLQERYGDKLPLEQSVVAPEDLYQSDLLETIVE